MDELRDRSAVMIVMGVAVTLLGAGCFLMLGFLLLGSALPHPPGSPAPPLRMLLPSFAFYGLAGVFFIVTGVGSIRARRWARALLFVTSWMWLVGGVFGCAVAAWLLPAVLAKMPEPPGAQGFAIFIQGCVVVVLALIYVLLPLVLVLFYGGRNVRATFARKDPGPSWTDRCPESVLAMTLWLGACASMLPMTLVLGAMVVFGRLVTGVPAFALAAAGSLVCAALAWGVYRLRPAAWWGTLALALLGGVAWSGFFWNADVLRRLYVELGVDISQMERIGIFSIFDGPVLGVVSTAGTVAVIGYLLWVRRHFRRDAA